MTLSATIHSELCKQYVHEKGNEHKYLVRSSLADFYGLSGIAAFFRKQADGERDHAMSIFEYIISRNEKIAYVQDMLVDEPEPSMLDIFKSTLAIEQLTTAKLNNLYMLANSEGDFMTASWLFKGLIPEQIEEENIIQSIIDRYNSRLNNNTMAGEGAMASEVGAALHDLDVYVKENFGG